MVFSAYILSWNILYAEPNKGILLLLYLLILLLTSSSFCFSSSSFLPPPNGSQYIAKIGFKLIRLLLPESPECWHNRCVPSHPVFWFFFSKVFYLLRDCFRGLGKKWDRDVASASMEGLGEMIPQKIVQSWGKGRLSQQSVNSVCASHGGRRCVRWPYLWRTEWHSQGLAESQTIDRAPGRWVSCLLCLV